MNYIKQLRAFYGQVIPQGMCGASEIALWHALMYLCNQTFWQTWFEASLRRIAVVSGLSKSGVLAARKRLVELGLIQVRTESTKCSRYRLISLVDAADNSVAQADTDGRILNRKLDVFQTRPGFCARQVPKEFSEENRVLNLRQTEKEQNKKNILQRSVLRPESEQGGRQAFGRAQRPRYVPTVKTDFRQSVLDSWEIIEAELREEGGDTDDEDGLGLG